MSGLARQRRGSEAGAERDWFSHDGALELAQRIERFWRAEYGLDVECRIEPCMSGEPGHPRNGFVVRSDLVGGMPKRAAEQRNREGVLA